MKYFKVSAYGDFMYYEAESLDDAKASFTELCGTIPSVTWDEVTKKQIPKGEEILSAVRD